jgi:hypothetical protein
MTSFAMGDERWSPDVPRYPAVGPNLLELGASPPIDRADPQAVLDGVFLAPYLDGSLPYAQRLRSRTPVKEGVLPSGGRLVRRSKDVTESAYLLAGDGWTMKLRFFKSSALSGTCEASIIAADEEVAQRVLREAGILDEAVQTVESEVSMGFWHLTSHGSARVVYRDIGAPAWGDIHGNYSDSVDNSFSDLARLTPDTLEGKGRLVLMYGPPGTGKTTAMRSLARAWQDWCHVDCVLDPDALFSNTGYLMDLTLYDHASYRGIASDRWRLLLIEDCDSLVRDDSRRTAGQSLARLLSLTDGLLGQGRNIIVAITTNEELSRLHPAVTRPGRCLSRMQLDRLSPQEAARWLGDRTDVNLSGGASLAELFAIRDGHLPGVEEQPSLGMYL